MGGEGEEERHGGRNTRVVSRDLVVLAYEYDDNRNKVQRPGTLVWYVSTILNFVRTNYIITSHIHSSISDVPNWHYPVHGTYVHIRVESLCTGVAFRALCFT